MMQSDSSVDLSYPSETTGKKSETQDKSRIESVKFIPVRCSYTDKGSTVNIHHSQGVVTSQLEDFMSRRQLQKFRNSYIEGNRSYLTCLRLRHNDESSIYIHSLSTSKSQALRTKKRVQKIADIYNNIYYREIDESLGKIQFGLAERIRSRSELAHRAASIIGRVLSYPVMLILSSLLLTAVLYGGSIVKGLSIMILSALVVSFAITSWIKFRTFRSLRTEENTIIKRDYNSQHRVILADIEDKEDRKILKVDQIDATWSFNKNDFGDLCGYEKDVYDHLDKIGNGEKAIVRVKPNVAGIDGLESDGGEYVLPQFKDRKRWII